MKYKNNKNIHLNQNNNVKSSKQELPLVDQIEKFLEKHHTYEYNEVTGYVEYKCHECAQAQLLTDYDLNSIYRALLKRETSASKQMILSILKSKFSRKYNPFHRYLNEQIPAWDGQVDYIQLLAETVSTTNDPLWQRSFRKWIVALVASLMDDEIINHTMIVLAGGQGIGKTTWLLNLTPPSLKGYYYSGLVNPDNKDTLVYLSETMLIICDELENLNQNRLGSLKDLITKSSVKLRRPYASVHENLPRRASFAASVNNGEFLVDTTGSRRFLCFDVISIRKGHNIPIDMVYSQALFLFRNGFQYWFDLDEIAEINRNNEQYRSRTLEEELLNTYFEPCSEEKADKLLSTSEIVIYFNEKTGLPVTNAAKNRLGKALKSSRFLRLKRKGRQVYALKEKPISSQSHQPVYYSN